MKNTDSFDDFDDPDYSVRVRTKSHRTRIKDHRSKRDRRRFYEYKSGKERARK